MINHQEDPQYATLGASGGVESVLFGFIFLYPIESIYFILLTNSYSGLDLWSWLLSVQRL